MKQYFIHDGKNQLGPFDMEQLKNMNVQRNQQVWCEGMEQWKPAGDVEELSVLWPKMPPQLPPVNSNSNSINGNPGKRKFIIILIAACVGVFVITLAATLLLTGTCQKNKSVSGDSLMTKSDSLLKATQLSDSAKGANNGNNGDLKTQTNNSAGNDVNSEEAQKEKYRKNWRSYVYVRGNHSSGPFGIVTNPSVTLTNNLPYTLNEVVVYVNYILVDGSTWRSEKVVFFGVGAHSTLTRTAPPTDRGTSMTVRISKVTSNALNLYAN
jgi:hypothetical protein